MIYMYPFNVINWVTMVLVCGAMSVCVGAVFSGVRWRYWDGHWQDNVEFHQENITDRLGWHHVMMSVATWPLILYTLTDRWNFKPMLTRDLDDRLYTKFAYSVTKVIVDYWVLTIDDLLFGIVYWLLMFDDDGLLLMSIDEWWLVVDDWWLILCIL